MWKKVMYIAETQMREARRSRRANFVKEEWVRPAERNRPLRTPNGMNLPMMRVSRPCLS